MLHSTGTATIPLHERGSRGVHHKGHKVHREQNSRFAAIYEKQLQQAACAVASADALLIAAGAGMGVDSGLPDFRGDHGFWRAYPPYQKLGLRFTTLANPQWFTRDPALAW